LDVEKYQIRMEAVDRLHGGGAGVRSPDDRHAITFREQVRDALTRERLVVHDQYAQWRGGHRVAWV
jgi:hypothetical protein